MRDVRRSRFLPHSEFLIPHFDRDNRVKTERSIKEFLAEAEDILETANQTLLSIERGQESGRVDPDLVNALFRSIHSFKGLSGMFGLQAPADLSHKLEFMLDELRLGKLGLGRKTLDVLFETVGLLGRLVQQLGKRKQPEDISAALGRIDEVLKAGSAPSDRAMLERVELDREMLKVLTEYEEFRLKENIRERKNLLLIKASFELDNFEKGIKRLNQTLKKYGEIICTLPTSGRERGGIGFTIVVGTGKEGDALAALLKTPNLSIEKVPYVEGVKRTESRTEVPGALRSVSNTVRVDIYRLDNLMNIVGEMHLTKNAIAWIARDMRAVQGFTGFAADLHKLHRNLERKLNELQEGILEVRMVPVGQIFTRLSQAVRKYAREAEKEVDLQLEGEETELDKLMIEDLADPLMHLIRNAVDHGIEPLGVRKQAGKPEQGAVRLTAFPKGNHVVITVEDDGAGMDAGRILAKAVEKGLVGQDHGLDPEADRREILDFIFIPGFSTAEKVTEISGRGVGMDVVKKNVSKLSGMIDIETEPGAGTKFIITLPITLAIIKALVVDAGKQAFAVPLSSVLEILRVNAGQIETVESREVMAVRDETIPLLRLTQAFNLPAGEAKEALYVVLVGLAERRLGLVVDGIRGQQEIVIKPLGKRLSETPGVAGATELGDQRGVVLVLDVESLIEGAAKRAQTARA